MPKGLSPYEKIQELQVSENFQMKIKQIRDGKNQAVTLSDYDCLYGLNPSVYINTGGD